MLRGGLRPRPRCGVWLWKLELERDSTRRDKMESGTALAWCEKVENTYCTVHV